MRASGHFVHTIINPMDVESGSDASISIMWSTTSKKNTISALFEPNHFVPLLPSAAESSKTISALKFKIQDFFLSSVASRRPANTTGYSVERTKRRSTLTVEELSQSENSQKRLAVNDTVQYKTCSPIAFLKGSSKSPMTDQSATAICEDKGSIQ